MQALSESLPENVSSIAVKTRAWNGVRVDVTEFRCTGRVAHRLDRQAETRLSVLLEEVGGRCEPRLRRDQPCHIDHMPRHMSFVPDGAQMWGYTDDVRFVRDATLSFDVEALGERLGERFEPDTATTPRLRFADDRVWSMVGLLAGAVDDDDGAAQLYGDGLTASVAALMFGGTHAEPGSKGLAPWQLKRAVAFLHDRLPNRVELAELAGLTGLSQSHFSRAFKASTGLAPYRWQLDARVGRAKAMLLDPKTSLDDVAEATGFADAVHFGRTFRKLTGTTPAAWRRDRLG